MSGANGGGREFFKESITISKKNWVITQEAFNRLLALLDADPSRAGEQYELLRARLMKFFECHGVLTASDLTDETFNRVCRRLEEGEEISAQALKGYCYGVARNLLKEHRRLPERHALPLDSLSAAEHPSFNSQAAHQHLLEKSNLEQQLACLEACLKKLPPETRRLIVAYEEEAGGKIENRRRLAEELGIRLHNLRVRAHRIREKLEKCLSSCLQSSPAE